jgi:hypothetical protein
MLSWLQVAAGMGHSVFLLDESADASGLPKYDPPEDVAVSIPPSVSGLHGMATCVLFVFARLL